MDYFNSLSGTIPDKIVERDAYSTLGRGNFFLTIF
jgi:hypothetical protein